MDIFLNYLMYIISLDIGIDITVCYLVVKLKRNILNDWSKFLCHCDQWSH